MTRQHDETTSERVRIPADVDRPDRLIGTLTARQLAILMAAAIGLWLVWAATRRLVALPVFAAFAVPLAAVAVVLAVGRWHGLPADQLLVAAARQQLTPGRRVPAPDGIPAHPGQQGLGALGLPVQAIDPDGTLHLAGHGHAVLASATAMSFALRTPAEREALAAGFGRYLNSVAQPIQILISAEPVDLTPAIHELVAAAAGLPHPLLEAACRDHADYLTGFAATHRLLRRDVLVVFRRNPATATEPGRGHQSTPSRLEADPDSPVTPDAGGGLVRQAADATAALAGAGVTLTVLDGPAVAARLARSLNPDQPARSPASALPDAVITTSSR